MKASLSLAVLAGFAGILGCAAAVPGSHHAKPGWNGRFASGSVGIYLMTGRKPFTVAQFECLSQGEESLKGLDSAVRWIPVDSGSKGVRELGGWDLDSLGDRLAADSAVWSPKPSPALSPSVREALAKVGRAYGIGALVVMRPGDSRNAKDSADSFRDGAWFGVFDASTGERLYALSVPVQGARSVERSAEADWARQSWTTFVRGIRAIRGSR